jgi:hypothetical protein
VTGFQTRKSEASSSATSRAISQGYFDWASGSYPPPPKQPQSMLIPRAHAEAMPMMNRTNSTAETTAIHRVSSPSTRQSPTTTSMTGSSWPTGCTSVPGSSW